MADDKKLFQVKFESGQGEQILADDEAAVRAQIEKNYGEDYAKTVTSVQDITPAKP